MTWRSTSLALIVAILAPLPLSGQENPDVQHLLDRMASYLAAYELQLSSVVADERFNQRVVFTRAYRNGSPVMSDQRRSIDSEVGFLRLPGGVDWLGFRDVLRINGKAVGAKRQPLAEILASTTDAMRQARAIASASAEHNLGVPRTTNVPTAALEIIHPRNYAAHEFSVRGSDTVRGTRVTVLGFTETRRPPLVQNLGGQELVSRGRIWLEPTSGAIWRVEWIYAPAIGAPWSLKVEFAKNGELGMLVPIEMREEFPTTGGLNARGDGVAVYTNYRRFATGGRIIQQP